MCAVSAGLPELVIDRAHDAPARVRTRGPARQTWHDADGRLVATGGYDCGSWWMDWPGLATYWFGPAGRTSAIPAPGAADADLDDIYVRGVLPVVLLARGFEALHASAVALDAGAVVGFCATSGTGKSTLALALTGTGARHFADDVLVYRLVDEQPVALSLPFPVRVDPVSRDASGTENAPARVAGGVSMPIRRVYQLARDQGIDPLEPRFTAVPAERRFEVLLAHAHPFDMGAPDRKRRFLQDLLTVARRVEVWECRFAPSLEALPALAARLSSHATS